MRKEEIRKEFFRLKNKGFSYAQWLSDVVKPFNEPSSPSLEETIRSISQAILKKI